MSSESEWPDPDIQQDPGIPGTKTPEQVPPEDEPEIERVQDSGPPDADDEGQMAPPAPKADEWVLSRRGRRGPR